MALDDTFFDLRANLEERKLSEEVKMLDEIWNAFCISEVYHTQWQKKFRERYMTDYENTIRKIEGIVEKYRETL